MMKQKNFLISADVPGKQPATGFRISQDRIIGEISRLLRTGKKIFKIK